MQAVLKQFRVVRPQRSCLRVQRTVRRCLAMPTHNFNEPWLAPCTANMVQLTPLSYLERSADLFGAHPALVYDATDTRLTYSQLHARCKRLASALNQRYDIQPGDVVSVMAYNTPPMLESHFGVPGSGAVLHTINTRQDAAGIAFQLQHAESKCLLYDVEFAPVVSAALRLIDSADRPGLVLLEDASHVDTGASDTPQVAPDLTYD